jgi:hypothetical protein
MSLQPPRAFPATITTGNSKSAGIDTGGGYLYVSMFVPSGTTAVYNTANGVTCYVKASYDGVNYNRFYEVYTNAVASPFSIQSFVSGAHVSIPYFNYRYIQIEVSGSVTGAGGGAYFEVICTDSL